MIVNGLGVRNRWRLDSQPYNAAKGAVVNLTRALALDLGNKGVRSSSVQPDPDRHHLRHDGGRGLLAKFRSESP